MLSVRKEMICRLEFICSFIQDINDSGSVLKCLFVLNRIFSIFLEYKNFSIYLFRIYFL